MMIWPVCDAADLVAASFEAGSFDALIPS